MHGFPKIMETNNYLLKLLWTVLLLISAVICVIFIYNAVDDYLDFNYLTVVRTVESKLFPEIVICTSGNKEFHMTEILFHCEFDDHKCSFHDFQPVSILNYLTKKIFDCYSFNGRISSQRKSEKLGFSSGLTLNFLMPTKTHNPHIFINDNGYVASYDNMGSFTTTIIRRKFTFLLNKVSSKKLGYPYNKCTHDFLRENSYSNYHNVLAKTIRPYFQKNCNRVCFDSFVSKHCNCTIEAGSYFDFSKCQDISCYFAQFEIFNFVEKCASDCPLECDSVTYSPEVKYILHPPSNLTSIKLKLEQNLNLSTLSDADIRSRTLELHFFYNDFKHTQLTEIAKTSITDLVSAVGGTAELALIVPNKRCQPLHTTWIASMIWYMVCKLVTGKSRDP